MARGARALSSPRHDIANTKVIRQIDLIEEGNWKLTMENNRECFRCNADDQSSPYP